MALCRKSRTAPGCSNERRFGPFLFPGYHLTRAQSIRDLRALPARASPLRVERDLHDAGQASILRDLHDRLDTAVAAAYGWPADLPEADILARLVALNAARRAEEEAGTIRWLRPAFQAPEEAARPAAQASLAVEEATTAEATPWPKRAPEQYVALRAALGAAPATPAELARRFARAPRNRMKEMLEALVAMGQARPVAGGRYAA